MNLIKLYYFLNIFLFSYFVSTKAAIKLEAVKNAQNVTEFTVIDGHFVEIPNRHRSQTSTLKFSVKSTTIDKVEKLTATSWSLKLNDSSSIDVAIDEVGTTVTEINLVWHGAGNKPSREVCLHNQHNAAFWYGGYQSNDSHWPMDTKHKMAKVQFNSMFELERLSVPTSAAHWTREFQFILEHLFLNSDGFAVHLDQYQPLYIRRDPNGNDALTCFSVHVDGHYYSKKYLNASTDQDLKVRLFASTNIRAVTDYVVHKSPVIPKPTEIPKDLNLFRNPTWLSDVITYKEYNQEKILEFASNLSTHGMSTKGEFVIEHYNWMDYSNYTINSKLFPHIDTMATNLTAKGIQLGGMLVSPRLAMPTKRPEFEKYVLHSHNHPLWYLDLSLPDSVKFYSSLLGKLHKDYKLNTFWLKSFYFWGPADFHDSLVNKYNSMYATKFIEAASKGTNASVVSEFAYKSQHLPVFTRIIEYYTTPAQQMLRELIPTVLSVSISGYSFILPYPVGTFDDHYKFPKTSHPITEEQYIRMLQATTFMPSMSFTKAPWSFSQKTVELTKKFLSLHAEHADTIIELARKRVKDGSPIIRPMWYVAPDDVKAFRIGDQFMLGENIVVAPVVVEGQRERNVYLPAGNWIDQHGKTMKGPGEFKVLAPLEELPYFKKAEH